MKFKKIKDEFNILMLKNSDFFDEKYYKFENPDVVGNLVKHYYYTGYKEGRNPSEKFDNNYYLKTHKDVKDAGVNPLVHYLRIGKKEKRKIRGFTGLTISKIYYKLYHEMYYANIHLTKRKKKTNLFVYDINDISFKIIENVEKMTSIDRIIYLTGRQDLLKKLSGSITLEKCYRDYYLNIGVSDINICIDNKSLMLLNHSCYLKKVYFYTEDISNYDDEFINYLSYYASVGKIKIISSNKSIKIPKTIINKFDMPNSFDSINFVFDYNFILGLEIINDYFLRRTFDNDIKFFYESHDIYCKISLDNELSILPKDKEYNCTDIHFNKNDVCFENKKILNFISDDYIKISDDSNL